MFNQVCSCVWLQLERRNFISMDLFDGTFHRQIVMKKFAQQSLPSCREYLNPGCWNYIHSDRICGHEEWIFKKWENAWNAKHDLVKSTNCVPTKGGHEFWNLQNGDQWSTSYCLDVWRYQLLNSKKVNHLDFCTAYSHRLDKDVNNILGYYFPLPLCLGGSMSTKRFRKKSANYFSILDYFQCWYLGNELIGILISCRKTIKTSSFEARVTIYSP